MNLFKTVFQMASPANAGAKLCIFIFHRILPETDPLLPDEPDARRFDQMMGWINSWFNVIPLDHAVDGLKHNNLPARAAVITFDDGYADNRTVALPILQRQGLPATFFIATGYLDGGRMWNDTVIEAVRGCKRDVLELGHIDGIGDSRTATFPVATLTEKKAAIDAILGRIKYLTGPAREAATRSITEQSGVELPNDLMMTSDQVIEMRQAGMLIGAHTVTHPILASLPGQEVRKEIAESKYRLESLLQEEIRLFAYPNGKPDLDYRAKDAMIVRDLGFDAALSTAWGVVDGESDLMQLPRFTPWDRTRFHFGARLVKNMVQNTQLKPSQTAS